MTAQNENAQAQAEQVEVANEAQLEQTAEVQQEQPVEAELAAAYARINELETYIAEADNREKDIQLRAQAEIQNIRRRAEQDVEKAHKFALEKFSKELLTVVDNLERGLNALDTAVTDEKTQALVDGVEMTHKEFISTLAKFGVEAVGVVGEAFNPEVHEAISMQPAEGIEANHISVVLQKGYTLQGRVLRPAMVMVAG
ncbi:nucleotide exchange factor GrpE [Actinobacillus pleuropneumoniae]|uniref:Protein GrpE n=3 Tax=Actinobacillus pleuropneumoniae TaxID=715 RepID=GRPE_ACTPJ|nr:nucleotide exchange factor GrpE [Actinobacillus pleuropneumoniae]B0BTB9.1 RecName: Full=Protein GrpE; AltName: Full=HSP-70 cofactor [Actinobacillus pleuropneumoniae serovar 3 str. JL03]ABY68976.1 heat shock protein [Actinobacillus pleuropneumoniae serovar 3 str. JL03]ASU16311.1 Protein GrpE [Actinobacillus pleuropneumoniae]AWG94785.1 nucleotide exchange factor GrpE [Actinobacillus pleuropneumoniae serovar 1 str. 4074]AXA20858.1 nucleotide exchange factor GrpE [Actinobacillus pleuropneumonia